MILAQRPELTRVWGMVCADTSMATCRHVHGHVHWEDMWGDAVAGYSIMENARVLGPPNPPCRDLTICRVGSLSVSVAHGLPTHSSSVCSALTVDPTEIGQCPPPCEEVAPCLCLSRTIATLCCSQRPTVLRPRGLPEQVSEPAKEALHPSLLGPRHGMCEGPWSLPALRGHPARALSVSALGSGGLGTSARQAIPYVSWPIRVLLGLPPLFWSGGSGPVPPPPPPLPHYRQLWVPGPAKSSWFFRPEVGVVSWPLPIQLAAASWERPHSPSWWVPRCAPSGGRGPEVPGSGTEKRGNPLLLLTLQAHVPEEEAALLSPCSPMWPQWDLGWC